MKPISLVMSTWNGKHLLKKFLPSVLEATRRYDGESEVIIVDDASSDGTDEFLQRHFPDARLIALEKNRGYGYACNLGIKNSTHDIVVLLNNDVWVKNDFLSYLPSHFDEEDVFAVRIRVFSYKDKDAIESGKLKPPLLWIRGELKKGFIYVPALRTCLLNESPHAKYAFSVSAGGFALDKNKWLALGGFDDLFYPGYNEETDIAYRALKRKWKIIYEPSAIAYHISSATISKQKNFWYFKLCGERNRYFIVWKNIFDKCYLLRHIFYIPLRLIKNIFAGDLTSFLAFFYGLLRLPEVFQRRKNEKRESIVTDREIFDFFSLRKKGDKDA